MFGAYDLLPSSLGLEVNPGPLRPGTTPSKPQHGPLEAVCLLTFVEKSPDYLTL